MSRLLPVHLLLLVFAFGLAGTASAQTAGSEAAASGAPSTKNPFADTPCAAEYELKCAHTRGWRLGFECLRRHGKAEMLAQECNDYSVEVRKKQRGEMLARQKAWQDACAEDIAANCSQFTRQSAIKGCLYRIRDQVAKACDENLPYRPGYSGPGFAGWRDGSEPENFREERAKKLRPRQAQRAENEKKLAEERAKKGAEARERLNKPASGEAEGSAAEED